MNDNDAKRADHYRAGVAGLIDMLTILLACEDKDVLASAAKVSLTVRMALSKLERIAGVTESDFARARTEMDQTVMAAKARIVAKGGTIDPNCEVP